MSIYLHDIPLDNAKNVFHEELSKIGALERLPSEKMKLSELMVGRILANPVFALISSPHYHAAAMDGFAVKSQSIRQALPSRPVELSLPEQSKYVDTGDPIPDGMDAVIPIEAVECLGIDKRPAADSRKPAFILIRAPEVPWSFIRPLGEDIVQTQLILPSGHTLNPFDLGALAAGGHGQVQVVQKPRVGIIPSGDELVPSGSDVKKGEIIEFNSIVLAAQVNSWGGLAKRYDIVKDDPEMIEKTVMKAVEENEMVLLNAGSSAGSEDYSSQVLEKLGIMLVHGVAVRPGHPVILGYIPKQSKSGFTVFIGVPGYPVSAALTVEIFVKPLLRIWLNMSEENPIQINATLTRKVTSPPGDTEYLKVVIGDVGGRMIAAPLSKGAGIISALSRADGVVIIPPGTQGLEAGNEVSVHLFRQLDQIRGTIFAIGSHDMTLDLLEEELNPYQRRLVSSNVGSVGGLVALSRKEAHFAGTHLLDPESGAYNFKSLETYLPNEKVVLVGWAYRTQGFLVKKDNAKKIFSLQDLCREDVTYCNRQKGSGTRLLLDHALRINGIEAKNINGYKVEESTHLTVAAAVASGRADCGLGVMAAATALDLDFIPLFEERYDLAFLESYLALPLLIPLFDILNSSEFKKKVGAIPGYRVEHMGEILENKESTVVK